ncbi:MAG TPA: hypothetical protein VJ747_05865 [Stellaceae bacterium]|nr:hypothetical protein [Stellaceae bacterium]
MAKNALAALSALMAEISAGASTATEIERFLDGDSDGGVLFHALYGSVADEPIPERLLAVLRNCAEEESETLPCAAAAS